MNEIEIVSGGGLSSAILFLAEVAHFADDGFSIMYESIHGDEQDSYKTKKHGIWSLRSAEAILFLMAAAILVKSQYTQLYPNHS